MTKGSQGESQLSAHSASRQEEDPVSTEQPISNKQMKTDSSEAWQEKSRFLGNKAGCVDQITNQICSVPASTQCRQKIRVAFQMPWDTKIKVLPISPALPCPAGLKSEGIYRVSGFTEHIEDVKMAFDRGECELSLMLPDLSWYHQCRNESSLTAEVGSGNY